MVHEHQPPWERHALLGKARDVLLRALAAPVALHVQPVPDVVVVDGVAPKLHALGPDLRSQARWDQLTLASLSSRTASAMSHCLAKALQPPLRT